MSSSGTAVRQSTILAREKSTALAMAVKPFSQRASGMISCLSSRPNNPSTGVAMNATPSPIIPDRKERTKSSAGMTK